MTVPAPATPERNGSGADDFLAGLPFPLDPFQREAIDAVQGGESVLVAAPTGSGKTVVAEFACWLALQTGAKCFYTTPLKALSNQKFGDLAARHGAGRVGLLTGDNSINGEAPLVVMTTEVLRNMLYEGSDTLRGLRWVVLDEVHYLQDPYRGAVWEEVLIHLPEEVRVVCLSATVSNVEEFGDWLATLRGHTRVVVERSRPVELRNLVMVGQRLHPLLDDDGRTNPELVRLWAKGMASAARYGRYPSGRPGYRGGNRAPGRPRRHHSGTEVYTPTRVEVVEALDRQEMLPAICFIFSRAGCDEAVEACVRAGADLTSKVERERITEFAQMRAAALDPEDLRALRFDAFLEGLQRGVAAHHAGMLPVFKETVEELFKLGWVKIVFATETLALGINMPARSVVIERLTKFTGERHELLTPTDYTQLTGRAGRRGMDEIGFGVTLFNPWVSLDKLSSLATQQSHKLTSSFRPSYNMAVNLVRRYDPEAATRLLNASFAQFVTDRQVVRWEKDLDAKRREAGELRERVHCERGDVLSYARLRSKADEAAREERGSQGVREALVKLVPGDVLWGSFGRAVVVEQPRRSAKGAPRVTAMTTDRKLRRLGPREFTQPPESLGKLPLRGQSWRSAKVRGRLARELAALDVARPRGGGKRSETRKLREAVEEHPCHDCPEIEEHLELASRIVDLEAEIARLERHVRRRTGTIARTFQRVLDVLRELGSVEDWRLTPKGELLRRVYNESDLLVVECLARGWLEGLDPDELAAVASLFVYESRRREEPEEPPTGSLGRHERRIRDLFTTVQRIERRHEVDLLKEPDAGFMGRIYEWARGRTLEDVLEDRETSPGDFVRSTKQVLDLLQQLRQVVETGPLADTLASSVDRVQRGVVAYSSVL